MVRYYPNVEDAINAELAQMSEIDNRINRQRIKALESQQHQYTEPQEIEYLRAKVEELENRIMQLELKLTQ